MIHFDPRWAGPHGIGRFSIELLARLGPSVHLVDAGVPKLSPLDPLATTLAVRRLRAGVYFTPGFNPPLRSPIPHVFCIHDLLYLLFAGESTLARRTYFRVVVRPATRHAFAVLTVSEYARRTILEWTGLPAERVRVVGNGVASVFVPVGVRHEPGYPYFLFVGRRTAHKNVDRLLAAYAASRCRSEVRMLFTGAPDRHTRQVARSLGIDVHFTGTLTDDALAECYRGAVALAWPSLLEGFGLPIVEAMACGTPVLTSDITAMPEVTGRDNALLVDPRSTEAIAAALDRLASDAALRERLRTRGLARARDFSWDAVAGRVGSVLAEAGARDVP